MIQRLLVNTGSNVLVMVVKLVITFIMTPVFVHNLGRYDYGLWEMLVSVIGYMGMLDLGIRPAISRYAAKYNAEEDRDNLLAVFSSTFFFMAFVGLCLLLFFSLWALWFPYTLAPEGESAQRYTLWLLIIGAQLLISFPGYVAESYLEGFQKYYLKNNITIFNSAVSAVVLYLFITPENGLLLLAAVNAIGLSVKYVVFFIVLARPVFGAIRIQWSRFSLSKLREIIRFGFKSLIQGVATRLESSTDVLIIGAVMGPAYVPFYSIPANLVQYLRTIGATLSHAFMPLFSDMSAKSENDKIIEVYLRASKYVMGIIFPMAVGILFVGGPFLAIWIGEEFQQKGELVILFLIVFTVFPYMNPFVSRYLTAVNRHGIFARLTPIAAVMNLVISLLLVEPFGIAGVAAASTIPSFIFVPIYFSYCCRVLGLPRMRYLKESLLPCFLPTLLLGLVVAGIRYRFGLHSYLDIVYAVLVSGVVWAPAFWFFAFDESERRFILDRLRKKVGG